MMDPADLSPDRLSALTEQLMLEQQGMDPLELLLASGALAYPDYEAWRMGRRPELQNALQLPVADVVALLRRAAAQASAFGLVAERTDRRRWGDAATDTAPEPLRIGADANLCRLLGSTFEPPPREQQLDLFYDSGAVAIEDSLRRALQARRLDDARAACGRLAERGEVGQTLADWLRLIAALDSVAGTDDDALTADPTPEERLDEVDALAPIAERRLGRSGARDMLALLWADLARLTAGQPFDPGQPRLHASWALARLGRWQEVRDAVEAEPDWPAQPKLLELHATACRHTGDPTAAMGDWFQLCWLHPEAAEATLGARDFPDAQLARCWSAFCDLDPPDDGPALETEDFPAWCLVTQPALAATAPAKPDGADPDRAAAYRAARTLAQAPDALDQRRALAAAHPTLLATLLQTRTRSG